MNNQKNKIKHDYKSYLHSGTKDVQLVDKAKKKEEEGGQDQDQEQWWTTHGRRVGMTAARPKKMKKESV